MRNGHNPASQPRSAACHTGCLESHEDAIESSQSPSNAVEFVGRRAFALLLIFVGLTQFLPGEPFLNDYFRSKGFSHTQVVEDILPLWIDFRVPILLATGILAEFAGSANVVLWGAVCGGATVAITVLCSSLFAMQFTQFTVAVSLVSHDGPLNALVFGLSSQSRAGYHASIHQFRAVLVASNFISGILGSLLLDTFHASYGFLWQIGLVAQLASVAVIGFLMSDVRKLHLAGRKGIIAEALKCDCQLWKDIWRNYHFEGVAEWQLWSISMHTVHILVATFWQALVHSKSGRRENSNGFASGAGFLFGIVALIAFARVPCLSNRTNRWWIITSSLGLAGLLVAGMGAAPEVWQVYLFFVLFQVVYRLSSAVAATQVGAEIRENTDTPRLALQISVSELMGSSVQLIVQSALKHWRSNGHPLPLSHRFEALGLGLCTVSVVFLAFCAARRAFRISEQ